MRKFVHANVISYLIHLTEFCSIHPVVKTQDKGISVNCDDLHGATLIERALACEVARKHQCSDTQEDHEENNEPDKSRYQIVEANVAGHEDRVPMKIPTEQNSNDECESQTTIVR